MDEPIRVLHAITGMGSGGAESFLMNMYRNIDRTKVQFDFLLCSNENIYAEELNAMGSRVFYIDKYMRHPIRNKIQTTAILQKYSYPIIHVHGNALINTTPLIEARKAGIPVRIMHSHSTRAAYPFLKPLHLFNKMLLARWCTDCLACSHAAGRWMFSANYRTIYNAIDIDCFCFDLKKRKLLRQEFNIDENVFVLGHVGRFFPVKNHSFILEVFQHLHSIKKDSILVLVGDGPLESEVYKMAEKANILEHVRFLGVRNDVGSLMNLFDAFIFPSFYEGLGIVAVEAQANGLPVICSNAIPEDATITNTVTRLPLGVGAKEWARIILNSRRSDGYVKDHLVKAGYDIHEEAKKLQEYYLSKVRRLQ